MALLTAESTTQDFSHTDGCCGHRVTVRRKDIQWLFRRASWLGTHKTHSRNMLGPLGLSNLANKVKTV